MNFIDKKQFSSQDVSVVENVNSENRISMLTKKYFELAQIYTQDKVMASIGLNQPVKPETTPPTFPDDPTALTHVQLSQYMGWYNSWAEFLAVTEGIRDSERLSLETYQARRKAELTAEKLQKKYSARETKELVDIDKELVEVEELIGYIKALKARIKVYRESFLKSREVLSRELTRRCQLGTGVPTGGFHESK